MWAEYALPYHEMIIEASQDPAKRQIGWMTRTHPLVLSSGRILLPLYSDGFNVGLAAISDDQGENWRASLPMVGLGPIQPSIVPKKDGTLVAYMRDSGDRPYRVLKSLSRDEGLTWSVALDTDIPNPGSSLEVISGRDGKWIMVYNDTEEGRHSLAVSVSDDEGATWKWKRILEKAERGKKSFAYPSLIYTQDGKIHLTYSYKEYGKATIKHISFDIKSITQ
jgi:predicted neuraminidase